MVIIRRFNYGRIQLLSGFTGETVGVRRKDGGFEYKSFLGFFERSHAQVNKLGSPVLLEAEGFYENDDVIDGKYEKLEDGELIQGCLTPIGVYAIIENGRPRLISLYSACSQK